MLHPFNLLDLTLRSPWEKRGKGRERKGIGEVRRGEERRGKKNRGKKKNHLESDNIKKNG